RDGEVVVGPQGDGAAGGRHTGEVAQRQVAGRARRLDGPQHDVPLGTGAIDDQVAGVIDPHAAGAAAEEPAVGLEVAHRRLDGVGRRADAVGRLQARRLGGDVGGAVVAGERAVAGHEPVEDGPGGGEGDLAGGGAGLAQGDAAVGGGDVDGHVARGRGGHAEVVNARGVELLEAEQAQDEDDAAGHQQIDAAAGPHVQVDQVDH